jgi:Conserved mid region of cactin
MDERYVKREEEKGHRSSSNGEHRHHHRHHKHHDPSHSRNRDKDGDRDHSEHRHRKRKDDHDRYDRDDRKRRPSPDRYVKKENSEKYERSDKYDRQIDDARPSRFDNGRPADRHEKDRFTSRETLDELRRERELKEGSRPSYRPEQRQQRPVPNNEGEDPLYKEWLAKEDDFMLSQAKKRAVIRVREGRAKPIDAFVVNLNIIEDGERDRKLGDDELEGDEFYITDADDVIKTLSMDQVDELKGDIHEYIGMEKWERNKQFWNVRSRWKSLLTFLDGANPAQRLRATVSFSTGISGSE